MRPFSKIVDLSEIWPTAPRDTEDTHTRCDEGLFSDQIAMHTALPTKNADKV